MIRLSLAWLHLLALGIGLGSVWVRGRALRLVGSDPAALRRAFAADNLWGVAAVLWLVTGFARALLPVEKGPSYYFQNPLFHAKLTAFLIIGLLEIWPIITLIRWRIGLRRGDAPDLSRARAFAGISVVQAVLLVVTVFLASSIARGFGMRGAFPTEVP